MTLKQFFQLHNQVAIAFSGGVDSAFLLSAAIRYGAKVKAYYVKSAFQPRFELEDAWKLSAHLGAEMEVLNLDILCHKEITANQPDRCYHCKKAILQTIVDAAVQDGYDLLLDGTNASDDASDRPGMRALAELSVRSPLRECGLTKEEIRRLSRDAGLFTWDKPAYACLATRTAAGEEITAEKLKRTETAETLLASLGFRDFRVRSSGDIARIQLITAELPRMEKYKSFVFKELQQYYREVTLEVRK